MIQNVVCWRDDRTGEEAVLEFILWSQLRSVAGKGWLLLDGIVTLVLAAMIWSTWPSHERR